MSYKIQPSYDERRKEKKNKCTFILYAPDHIESFFHFARYSSAVAYKS